MDQSKKPSTAAIQELLRSDKKRLAGHEFIHPLGHEVLESRTKIEALEKEIAELKEGLVHADYGLKFYHDCRHYHWNRQDEFDLETGEEAGRVRAKISHLLPPPKTKDGSNGDKT